MAQFEVERRRQLHDAMSLLGSDRPEQRRIQDARSAGESQIEIATVETPQRVIEEVVSVQADLQPLLFGDCEVLEQAEIGVEERGSVNHRQSCGAVLSDLRREAEAARIDELMRSQIRARIAGQNRRKLNVGRAQQRSRADVLRGARDLRAVQRHAEVLTALPGEVDAAL